MSDILLFQTEDGGEVEVTNGVLTLTNGLETASYLSMFGGDDWFANVLQDSESSRLTGETQTVIDTTPPSSAGLLLIEDAAVRDHAWMIADGLASKVTATATLSGSVLGIEILVEYDDGETNRLDFSLNWTSKNGGT